MFKYNQKSELLRYFQHLIDQIDFKIGNQKPIVCH